MNENEPKPYSEDAVKEGAYFHEEVPEIRESMRNILERIMPELESGAYGLIIGDDASGRVPTKVLSDICHTISKEKGFSPPEVRFLPGSSHLHGEAAERKKEDISEYLARVEKDVLERRGEPLAKALIVTDLIDSGVSLTPLAEALEGRGIDFSVAAVADISKPDATTEFENRWGGKIVAGDARYKNIYGNHRLGGVYKESGDIVSRSGKKMLSDEDDKDELQWDINTARINASHLASELYSEYRTRHKEA